MKETLLTSSPWGFRERPVADFCRWLKEHELQYICGHFGNFPGAVNFSLDDRELDKVNAEVNSFGLQYASFNADGDFMMEKAVDDQVALCCRMIDRAVKFQPKVIIVFAGWQDRKDQSVYGQVSDCLKQVARHAARYHLTVALENHGGLTASAEQINRILDAVNEPNIGINYDPANFLMYGEDPLKSLLNLKHPLVFTHFKSVKRMNGKEVYCRLKEGEIDYLPILEILKKEYRGFYAIEYEETSDVMSGSEDDLNSLKNLLDKVGHHV
ncbi:MAG: sugar phosphate isomerase/epimerase family protein [Phycisphaerae bacterium]